jgi:hypothetical protein
MQFCISLRHCASRIPQIHLASGGARRVRRGGGAPVGVERGGGAPVGVERGGGAPVGVKHRAGEGLSTAHLLENLDTRLCIII